MQPTLSFSRQNTILRQKRTRLVLLTALLLAACIQNIVLFDIGASFKLAHLAGVLLFPVALLQRPARPMGKLWWASVGVLAVYTAVAYLVFGFNSWLLNGIFCLYTVWCVWKLCGGLDKEDWLRIFRTTAVIILVIVTVNILLQFEKIWAFMEAPGLYHPVYNTIFGGGPNLDASWIGLFCFVMAGTVWWRPYYATSVIISLLTSSRAGLLANAAFAVWIFVHWVWVVRKKKTVFYVRDRYDRKKSALSIVLVLCIMCAYGLAQGIAMYGNPLTMKTQTSSQSIGMHGDEDTTEFEASPSVDSAERPNKGASASLLENLTERMTSIGDEPGSKGRLNMWQHIPTVLAQNPLGYGLGNGIEAVRNCDPENIPDGNLHNIYFQALLDFGIPGAVCLLAAVFIFIKKELPTLAAWPVAAFILCYLCLGMIQYRMLEVPAWIAITAYVSVNSIQKKKGDHAEV